MNLRHLAARWRDVEAVSAVEAVAEYAYDHQDDEDEYHEDDDESEAWYDERYSLWQQLQELRGEIEQLQIAVGELVRVANWQTEILIQFLPVFGGWLKEVPDWQKKLARALRTLESLPRYYR